MLEKIDYLITRGLLEASEVQRGLGKRGGCLVVLGLVVGLLVGACVVRVVLGQ